MQLEPHSQKSPNKFLSSKLTIAGASTKVLPHVGTVQKINADIIFYNHLPTINVLSAIIGNQLISIIDSANYKDLQAPVVDIRLIGKEVPLTRSAGLVLFRDVDLTAKTDSKKVTTIGGNVVFTKGHFSVEQAALQALTSGLKRRSANFSVIQNLSQTGE